MSKILTQEPVIGIIGGMGPEATLELMRRIIQRTPARDDADHIRMLVDNNPKVPSRIAYLLEGGAINPGPVLVQMALGLQSAGATHLVMPCNTAHHFAAEICAAVRIPFIDMLDAALAACTSRFGKDARIGIAGSPALRAVGILDRKCTQHGLEVVYPDRDLENFALMCIRQIKAGRIGPEMEAGYSALKDNLRSHGADALLICCTEFSVLETHSGQACRGLVDTLDELTSSILSLSGPLPPD